MANDEAQPELPSDIREVTDARSLRALTHPVRIALIEELVHGGAMTATELGERIGETPTTCSFHLRQLAKYGFVEEAGGGRGRSRPWRLTTHRHVVRPGRGDPEAQVASEAALRLFRERQLARYETWRRPGAVLSAGVARCGHDSEYLFYLTAGELAQLNAELHEVLMRWCRLDGAAGGRRPGPAGRIRPRWRRCCSTSRSTRRRRPRPAFRGTGRDLAGRSTEAGAGHTAPPSAARPGPAAAAGLPAARRGQVTSNVGDACYAVALPWYVLAGHGGTVLLGTVLAAYGIPRTALIMVGGYASDRWRPQTVMLATDSPARW